jgi:hypothetical protein
MLSFFKKTAAARLCPTRLGRNRVDPSLDQALEASLCTRALTASPDDHSAGP